MPHLSLEDARNASAQLEKLYGHEAVRYWYNQGRMRMDTLPELLKELNGGQDAMPIEGLSDRTLLPRVGKIHLGVKHPVKGYPMATEYFVLPEDHPQYDALVAAFGAEPKELRIIFPLGNVDDIASQWYKQYSQTRGLICKGDGLTCNRVVDTKTGEFPNKDTAETEWKERACGGQECPDYLAKKCKEMMCLQFMLPEIPGLGIWQIDTGSVNSIIHINSQFVLLNQTLGTIAMQPLILSLEPKEVKVPPSGKLKTVRVMHIRSGVSLIDAARVAMMTPLERLTGGKMLALPPGDMDAPDILIDDADNAAQVERDIEELWEGKEMQREPAAKQPPASPKAEAKAAPTNEEIKHEAIREDLGAPEEEEGVGPVIDTALLERVQKELKWMPKTIISFLEFTYLIDSSGTLEEVIARLTMDQAAEFYAQLNAKLKAQGGKDA